MTFFAYSERGEGELDTDITRRRAISESGNSSRPKFTLSIQSFDPKRNDEIQVKALKKHPRRSAAVRLIPPLGVATVTPIATCNFAEKKTSNGLG